MKVLILADGKIAEVNDSYGARLLEQGKAVIPAKTEKKADKAEEPVNGAPVAAAKPARKK